MYILMDIIQLLNEITKILNIKLSIVFTTLNKFVYDVT